MKPRPLLQRGSVERRRHPCDERAPIPPATDNQSSVRLSVAPPAPIWAPASGRSSDRAGTGEPVRWPRSTGRAQGSPPHGDAWTGTEHHHPRVLRAAGPPSHPAVTDGRAAWLGRRAGRRPAPDRPGRRVGDHGELSGETRRAGETRRQPAFGRPRRHAISSRGRSRRATSPRGRISWATPEGSPRKHRGPAGSARRGWHPGVDAPAPGTQETGWTLVAPNPFPSAGPGSSPGGGLSFCWTTAPSDRRCGRGPRWRRTRPRFDPCVGRARLGPACRSARTSARPARSARGRAAWLA